MLVMYKGWGYFGYEIDLDYMKISDRDWIGSKTVREREQRIETCAFELPKFALEAVKLRGEISVDYLLLSKHSYIDEMDLNFHYPEKDEIRFYLCEDEPIFKDDYPQQRELKTVKYTINDIFEAPLINEVPEDQAESLKDIGSVSDQHVIDSKKVSTEIQANSRSRRPAQIKLLLSVIAELEYDPLNIPIGGKQKVLEKCLNSPSVFSSESVFNRVWSGLSNSDQISITGKEKFFKSQ